MLHQGNVFWPAFPQTPAERTELTTVQQAFLSALVANGHQPFGEARGRRHRNRELGAGR
jgi:hypothetical protein